MENPADKGYLKDEYVLLQNLYEDYDRRSLTIKGWMSVASVAGIGLGFGEHGSPRIWLVVAATALCIWYLEGRWKLFQHGLRDRIRILEAAFRGEADILVKDPAPFQIYSWWFKSTRYDTPIYPYETATRPRPFIWRLLTMMVQDFVFLPYLPIVAFCLYFYCSP